MTIKAVSISSIGDRVRRALQGLPVEASVDEESPREVIVFRGGYFDDVDVDMPEGLNFIEVYDQWGGGLCLYVRRGDEPSEFRFVGLVTASDLLM